MDDDIEKLTVPSSSDQFDEEVIAEALGIFGARFAGVIADFLEDAHAYLKTVSEALEVGDIQSVVRAAHPLKSAAGSMGATSLFKAARAMELNARKIETEGGAPDLLVEILPHVKQALDVAQEKFKSIADSL